MKSTGALDLVVLVPGADERETLDELLSHRQASLGIRSISHRLVKHLQRDSGCFHTGPQILQPFQRIAHHALVVFDHEGSGQEARSAQQVTDDVERRLSLSGWGDRAAAVVIEPELEVWVWSDSPEVDRVLGWRDPSRRLRPWLAEQGLWSAEVAKPRRPKESLERALHTVRVRRSAAIYRQIARRVGLERCQDPAFLRLRNVLHGWFPKEPLLVSNSQVAS